MKASRVKQRVNIVSESNLIIDSQRPRSSLTIYFQICTFNILQLLATLKELITGFFLSLLKASKS